MRGRRLRKTVSTPYTLLTCRRWWLDKATLIVLKTRVAAERLLYSCLWAVTLRRSLSQLALFACILESRVARILELTSFDNVCIPAYFTTATYRTMAPHRKQSRR